MFKHFIVDDVFTDEELTYCGIRRLIYYKNLFAQSTCHDGSEKMHLKSNSQKYIKKILFLHNLFFVHYVTKILTLLESA